MRLVKSFTTRRLPAGVVVVVADSAAIPAFAASNGPGSRGISRGPAAAASTDAERRIGRSPTCDPKTIAMGVRPLSTPP